MADFLGLFGASPDDYFTGSKWQQQYGNNVNYNPTAYGKFDPASYAGGMGTNYQNAVNTQLSGQLSPAVQQYLNSQFASNLQSTRTGSYGMPAGAQNYNELQVGSQNALQGALLGEQQIQAGESAAMPYLSMGQNENQFAANFGENQNEFASNLALSKAKFAGSLDEQAQKDANSNQGIFGKLIAAGTSWGLNQLFPEKKKQNNDEEETD